MLHDLRIAVRALRKNPVFSATAVAVLALGIGANSAIFGLVNQALFAPPGLSDPSRVVAVRARYQKLNLASISLSGARLPRRPRRARHLRVHGGLRAGHATSSRQRRHAPGAAGGQGVPGVVRRLRSEAGARPRRSSARKTRPSGQRAVVLAHAAWVRLFGSEPPASVGTSILIDDKPTKVVGVMPPDFRWPQGSRCLGSAGAARGRVHRRLPVQRAPAGRRPRPPERDACRRERPGPEPGRPRPQRVRPGRGLRQVVAVGHVRDAVHRLRGRRFASWPCSCCSAPSVSSC